MTPLAIATQISELEDKILEMERVKEASPAATRAHNELVEAFNDFETKQNADITGQNNGAGLWKEEIAAFLDSLTLKSLFFSDDWVFIVVDLIANKISSQPLRVFKKTIISEAFTIERADGHQLNELFLNPNPMQDYHSWMYNTVVELALMGNSIIWNAKNKNSLTTLPTELMSLDLDNKCKIRNYRMASNATDGAACPEQFVNFKPDNIMHIRKPNPSSLLWGLSPFVPGRKSVLFNRYSQDYLNAFYLRQATPGLALKMEKQVNEDVALRQLRTFELAYSGRANQRRTLILPKGVDVKPLSHNLSDQKLVDMIDKNRETIINLFKIPKHELGLQKVGSLGSEEHRLALRNFWEACLIPMMALIEGGMTKYFAKELGKDHVVKFDLAGVDALAEDKIAKATLAKELLESGWSVNEVRAEIYFKDGAKDENANRPYNLVRLDKNTAMLGTREDGEEVVGNETEPEPVETDEDKALLPTRISNWVDFSQKQLDLELADKTSDIENDTMASFSQMADVTVDQILAKAIANDDEGLTGLEPVALALLIGKAFIDLKADWVSRVSNRLTPTVELGYDQEVDLVSNSQDRSRLERFRDENLQSRKRLLGARLNRAFDLMSETATAAVLKDVEQGIRLGESISAIADRVVKFYSVDNARFRAERIARTEVLTAASIGQWEAVQDAKKVNPKIKKMWVTASDERVRSTHQIAGAQGSLSVDKNFSNGLRFPRDPLAFNASEVVNCRCSLVLIEPDNA